MTGPKWRGFAVALAIGAAVPVSAGLLAGPAHAQFWERYDRQQQQAGPRDYFPFRFFGDRDRGAFGQPTKPAQAVDSSKAPSPRKVETPPTSTVLVIGDSFADWLGYGLEEAFTDTPEIGIVRKIRPTSGLIRYDGRNENLDWWQAAKDMLASEKPSAIVVMLGLNDRISIRDRAPRGAASPPAGQAVQPAAPNSAPAPAAEQNAADAANAEAAQPPAAPETPRPGPGASYEFHTDKWGELYEKRIDDMIAVLKAKGVPVVWVGLPAIRGPRSTSDMSYLDELFRARAEKASITYVDVWDGFVDESGRYAVQGPDFEGQTRRLRSGDGIHFTKPGAVKLAHYVEHELRRLMSNHVVPVALPTPEEQAPQNGAPAGVKPAIGPVVPLTAALGAEGGDLLGGGGRPEPPKADPIVLRVLSHGDAIAAPAGRADDFSWPRSEFGTRTSATGSASAEAEPSAAGAAGRSDQKKSEPQPQTAVTEPDPPPVQQPPSLVGPPKADDVKKPEPRRQSTGQGRGQGATQGAGQGTGQGAAQGAAQANPGAAPAAPPKQRRTRTTQENAPRPPLPIGGWRPNTW
jgi:hypothetical protein